MINCSKYLFVSIIFIASLNGSSSSQKNRTWDVLDKNYYSYNSNLALQNNNISFRTNNSRNLLENLTQIDSSLNGYGYISNVVSPISYFNNNSNDYNEDDNYLGGLVISYNSYHTQNGFFGTNVAQSQDFGEGFEEFFIENRIIQDSKFPSSHIFFDINANNASPKAIIVADAKNEENQNSDRYLPHWTNDFFPVGELSNFRSPDHINGECYNNGDCFDNEPTSLIQSQIINFTSADNFSGSKIFVCVQNDENDLENSNHPNKFYFDYSLDITNGYITWDVNNTPLFDFSEENEVFNKFLPLETIGRPIFNINKDGVGYFVWSAYRTENEDTSSHSIHIKKTEDFGDSWDVFDDHIISISDEKLNEIFHTAGLLGSTVNDGAGNTVQLDEAFVGYNYEVYTNAVGGIHIIAVVIPKNSQSDSLYFSHEGAGYYHIFNNDPNDQNGWFANPIRDMSESYKTKMHPTIPTWQYFSPDLTVGIDGKMYVATSVAMDVTLIDGENYSHSDTDIFLSISNNFGSSWEDLGNITNTPSGTNEDGEFISQFELHPHLTPVANSGRCFLTFQVPALTGYFPEIDIDNHYEAIKNYIYVGSFGSGGGDPSSIIINEIMQNPAATSDSNGEWFELFNPSEDTIDIKNWSVNDSGGDNILLEGDNCCEIAPRSYFLLVANGDENSNGGISNFDYVYNRDNFTLGNSSDEIILKNSFGFAIDKVEYNEEFPDPNGKSMELLFYEYDNNVGSNWIESENLLQSGDYGTPGVANSRIEPTININEIISYQDQLTLDVSGWSDVDGQCLVADDVEGYIINECDTAFFDIIISNDGSGDLIIEDCLLEGLYDSLEYIDRWNISSIFPINIPPNDNYTLGVYYIPWREINDYSNWFGLKSSALKLFHNADTNSINNQLELSVEVYIDNIKAYSIEVDDNSEAAWEYYDSNSVLVFNDITFDGTLNLISYGTEDLEIDDINLDSDYFNLDAGDGTVSSGESITLQLDFNPPNDGVFVDTILIESNADIFFPAFFEEGNDNPQQKIIIKGTSGYLSSVNNEKYIPDQFIVHQNYPNPFNPVTSLKYDLPEEGLVNITVYDMMGRVVKTLVNSQQTAGYKSITWNATNNRNETVSAGLYLYTIQAGEFRQTRKMVLLK